MLGLGLGLMISYSYGFAMGVKWTVTTGYNFLQANGIDFSLTAQQITDLITTYKQFFENANGGLTVEKARIIIGGAT